MKKVYTLFIAALLGGAHAWAIQAPDAPGTKLVTVQAGGFPGIGGLVSGQIAMTTLGKGHLYGGFQLGGQFRHGKATDARMTDLSFSPRIQYGFNLGRVVELHAGGLAGIDVRKMNSHKSELVFCYGGFGGLRLNLTQGFGLVAEGGWSNCLPYATAGVAFRF